VSDLSDAALPPKKTACSERQVKPRTLDLRLGP